MVDKNAESEYNNAQAEVAEQADALRSGRSGLYARVGSTPTFGTLWKVSRRNRMLGVRFFVGTLHATKNGESVKMIDRVDKVTR